MFIGMIYDAESKVCKWLDKQDVTWAPWDDNEPDCMGSDPCASISNQNCVRMTTSYKFRSFRCNYPYYVLCGKGTYVKSILNIEEYLDRDESKRVL